MLPLKNQPPAARSTRWTVSARTPGRPFSTQSTVAVETPARAATSSIRAERLRRGLSSTSRVIEANPSKTIRN